MLAALSVAMMVAVSCALMLAGGRPAQAAEIVVNTTEDKLGVDGDCSLRAAIRAANTDAAVDGCPAGSGADTIVLAPGVYTLSIANVSGNEDNGLTGDLDITSDITIVAAEPGDVGATAIDAAGIDRVLDVRTSNGALTLTGVTVRGGGNVPAPSDGAGIRVSFGGTLTLIDAVVSANAANGLGGGIYNQDRTVAIVRSTISGNTAAGGGGGIAVVGFNPSIEVTNSTVSGNTSGNLGGGGGIHFGITDDELSVLVITNTTIAANTNGGIRDINASAPAIKNTIVGPQASGTDCQGLAGHEVSLGHNIDSDDSCGFEDLNDIAGVDPLLGPLQDNGGPTHTHALLEGSPAIDAADDTACPETDQRGIIRPQGAQCDIGAYEFEGAPPTETPTPTSTATPTPTATATPTATPTVVLEPVVAIDVAELIGVADVPVLRSSLVEITVAEAIGVRDEPAVRQSLVEIAVDEAIGVADAPELEPAALLLAPSDLVAVALDQHTIVLFWTDNATGEQGFELQRGDASGSFETIAVLPPDSTFFQDFGLEPDSFYAYRVRAFAGDVFTDWSNVAFAMTFPDIGPPVITFPFIIVNSAGDTNARDGVLTLREAMLIAVGQLSIAALDAGECASIPGGSFDGICTSTSSFGAGSTDRITFSPAVFPPDAPATIALTSALPPLSTSNDVITGSFLGLPTGVIVDGGEQGFDCFALSSQANALSGLQIRRCEAGVRVTGASNHVGGASADRRNVISGNDVGVLLSGPGSLENVVRGNYIGVDAAGVSPAPNRIGVRITDQAVDNVVGGAGTGDGNVISGNTEAGVLVSLLTNAIIDGNSIGVDAAGTGSIPNGLGINITSAGAEVGSVGAGNVIAHNAGSGIRVSGSSRAMIRANSIHSNGGVGIEDLSFAVRSPDVTQAFSESMTDGSWNLPLFIAGDLQFPRAERAYIVDFYASPGCGPGEGKAFLGTQEMVIDRPTMADFEMVIPGSGPVDQFITAIVTDEQLRASSPFSQCEAIQQAPATPPAYARCTHTPVWPMAGDTVTIRVEALDASLGLFPLPDTVEIWVDATLAASSTSKESSFEHSIVASTDGPLAYSCRVRNGGNDAFSGWRVTTVGVPATGKAVPVVYTASPANALDILFIADDSSYTGSLDAQFLDDVAKVIREAYYSQGVFLANQLKFNFWVAFHTGLADRSSGCKLLPPDGWYIELTFVDTGAILHTDEFRDCAKGRLFSTEPFSLGTVIHETGHSPFGLADEYCCDGGYFETKEEPNVYKSEEACQEGAPDVGRTAADCRTWTDTRPSTPVPYWTSDPRTDDMMVDHGPFRALDLRRINWLFGRCDAGEC